jgi:hypothetical protein
MAVTFAHDDVAAGKHPVEVRVVVLDVLDRGAHVAEQLADLFLTGRQAPFGEVHLSVVGEQVKNAAAGRDHSCVVEPLQVFQDNRLALLVGHRLSGECHRFRSSWCLWAGRGGVHGC